jgi:hypothetical protein
MKLAEIAMLLEAYELPPVNEALPRILALIGKDQFAFRKQQFERIMAAMQQGKADPVALQKAVAKLKELCSVEDMTAMAGGQQKVAAAYGGNARQLQMDCLALSKVWMDRIEAVAKEKGINLAAGPQQNVWARNTNDRVDHRGARAMQFNSAVVTMTTKQALFEMGVVDLR